MVIILGLVCLMLLSFYTGVFFFRRANRGVMTGEEFLEREWKRILEGRSEIGTFEILNMERIIRNSGYYHKVARFSIKKVKEYALEITDVN